MKLTGQVTAVIRSPQGGNLNAPLQAGDLSLSLDTLVDFDDLGGELLLPDQEEPLLYLGLQPNLDDLEGGSGRVLLAEPAPTSLDEGEPIITVRAGEIPVDFLARVQLDEGEEIEVEIPYAERALWPETIYDPPVMVDLSEDLEQIVGVPHRAPTIDGALIDPDTLPDPTVPTEPPLSSPALTMRGTANGLLIWAENVAQTTLITYHITDHVELDPVTGEPIPFTPTAETQVGDATTSTVLAITQMPDGTALRPDVTYYVRAVASNILGSAPPSPMSEGQLDLNNVAELIAERLVAGFVLAGAIQVGQITIQPPTATDPGGITIPSATSDGAIVLPADGSEATISGSLRASSISVENHLTIDGEQNAVNGALKLANGVTKPQVPPSVTNDWEFIARQGTDAEGGTIFHGLTTKVDDPSKWVTSFALFGGGIQVFDKTTGALDYPPTLGWGNGFNCSSITAIGTNYYVLGSDSTRNGKYYVYRLNASFAKVGEWLFGTNVPFRPTIGADESSGDVLVAWCTAAGNLRARYYIPSSGALRREDLISTDFGKYHLSGVYNGNGDWTDGVRLLITPRNAASGTLAYRNTGGAGGAEYQRITTLDFPRAGGAVHAGLAWDSIEARFYGMDESGRIWKYAKNRGATVSVAYSWYDSTDAGTGPHETEAGPARSFNLPPRSRLVVTTAKPNYTGEGDSADSARIYVNNHRQSDLAPQANSASYDVWNALGAAAPTSNGFASAETRPGRLLSDAADSAGSLVDLWGSGAGRVGPLTFDSAGRLVKWDVPAASYDKTSDQNIPNSTYTTLSWNARRPHPQITGSSVLTVKEAGLYVVAVGADFASNAAGSRYLRILKNGANQKRLSSPNPGGVVQIGGMAVLQLAANDTFEIEAYQSSGGALTVAGNTNNGTTLEVYRVG